MTASSTSSAGTPSGILTQTVRRHVMIRWFVILGGALAGVAQGFIWLAVAPGRQYKVFADGSFLTLPTADYHAFDAVMIFVFSGAAIGLVMAVAVWQIRAIRGVRALISVVVAAIIGAAIAFAIATLLAGGVDPATVGASSHASVVVAGPSLGTPLVLIAEPLAAAVVYTFLAAWDGRKDLGRHDGAAEQSTDAAS